MRLRVFVPWRFGGDGGAPSRLPCSRGFGFWFWPSEWGHGQGPLLPLLPGLTPQPRAWVWAPVFRNPKSASFPCPRPPFLLPLPWAAKTDGSSSVCSRPMLAPSSGCKMDSVLVRLGMADSTDQHERESVPAPALPRGSCWKGR